MNDKKMLKTGIIGSVIFAIGCFSPALVLLFGFLGLSAVVGYLDYGLYPALAGFLLLTIYALVKRQKRLKMRRLEQENG